MRQSCPSAMGGEKVVYFVRHGEAAHNANFAAYGSSPDTALTPRGQEQASVALRQCLRTIIEEGGRFDAVVTSPMTRAIETCLYSTEGLLRVGTEPRVEPLCTERGSSVCDRGSPKSALQQRFPALDLSALSAEVWWDREEERYGPDSAARDYVRHGRLVSVRALAEEKIEIGRLLRDEMIIGIGIGLSLGGLAAAEVHLVFGDALLSLAVGLAILCGGAVSAVVGFALPWAFDRLGADPALGSGPVCTVIQDAASLAIYFVSVSLFVL